MRSWKTQESWVMVSSFWPRAQKARPWMECECATQFTSGRAVCTAWCIMYAAVLSNLTGPLSSLTILPSALTSIKSLALKSGQATPKGLTQKLVGSTGSCLAISCHNMILSKNAHPQSNMPRNPLIKPQLCKNPKRQRQPPLLILPLLQLILKLRRARELQPTSSLGRLLSSQPRLVGRFASCGFGVSILMRWYHEGGFGGFCC